MIYNFLKWYATIGIKFFYKNVFIQYDPELLGKFPVIYASNHPSGFYESLIFATISKYAPIYLVRSDYVTIKGLMGVFKMLKLYPIYRQSEGLKDVSKNTEVFQSLYKELENNTPICIYPEGTTKFNFRIRPIKKGISRLALGAKINGIEDIKIVPIAFNFVEPVKFRSNIFILSSNLMDLHNIDKKQADAPATLRSLTIDIESALRNVAIDLESKEQHELFKKLQQLYVNNDISQKKLNAYVKDSKLPQKIYDLSTTIKELNDEKFTLVQEKTDNYISLLARNNTNDKAVIDKANAIVDDLKLVFGYPLYVLGLIANALPILFALYIQKKKIKQYEYKTVVTILIAQFSYIIYLIILLVISLFVFSAKGLFVLTFPILAWYSLKFYDFKNDYFARKNLQKSNTKQSLTTLRQNILKLMGYYRDNV